MPTIAGSLGIMQHQTACGPLTTCLLELIEPSSIIGHITSSEKLGVVVARIVYHSNHNLALHIDVGIVVPTILRGMDAKANEYIFRLRQHHLVGSTSRPHHHIIRIAQLCLLSAFYRQLAALRLGCDRDQLEGLKPAAVESRLQAYLF